ATLAPFTATLEQLQDEPKATRLAAILTGFLNELLQSMPIGAKASIPLFRWCDLWTRSMIAALRQPPEPAGEPVSGTFSPLGVDLRGHGYLVSADVYGLLETGGPSRVARMTISAYKVDVLTGSETWRCFEASWRPVLEAISRPAT